MIFVNAVYKEEVFPKEYALNLLKLLNPIVPHVTEELNSLLGNDETITYSTWPSYDESTLVEDTYQLIVQVNGKVRGKIEVPNNYSKDELLRTAKEIDNVNKFLVGKTIVKEIVIPRKIVNIVVK
jgi:leucyl-tRNA synthetase